MPTALELSRDQWKRFRDPAHRRPALADPTPAQQQAREQLLERARDAAALLKKRWGARRVVLFGSLARAPTQPFLIRPLSIAHGLRGTTVLISLSNSRPIG